MPPLDLLLLLKATSTELQRLQTIGNQTFGALTKAATTATHSFNAIYGSVYRLNILMGNSEKTLQKIQAAGSKTFSSIEKSAGKAINTFGGMQQSISHVNDMMDDMERTIHISVDQSQLSHLNKALDSIEYQLDDIGQRAVNGTGSGGQKKLSDLIPKADWGKVFQNAQTLIDGIAKDEMAEISLSTLTGSRESAGSIIKELTQYANTTPYGKDELIQSAEMLKAYGVSNTNVLPSVHMLGDVAKGDPGRLQSLTAAYSQTMGSGILSKENADMMKEQGFDILAEMVKTTGQSLPKLNNALANGAITAKDMALAFQSATSEGGNFHNVASSMGASFGSRMNDLRDGAFEAAKSIMSDLLPAMEWLLSMGGKLLEFKEVVATFGLAWLAYSAGQGIASLASDIFKGKLISLRGALIATGVGAILVLVGLLWNLFERIKNVDGGLDMLKKGFTAMGMVARTTISILKENVSFALESMGLRIRIFFDTLGSAPLKLLTTLNHFFHGRWGEAMDSLRSLFTADPNSENSKALTDLEKKHKSTLTKLKGEQESYIIAVKDNFNGLRQGLMATPEGSEPALEPGTINNQPGLVTTGLNASAASTTSGGPRSVIINIGKFQDAINIYAQGIDHSMHELDKRITETLLRVVNSAAIVQ